MYAHIVTKSSMQHVPSNDAYEYESMFKMYMVSMHEHSHIGYTIIGKKKPYTVYLLCIKIFKILFRISNNIDSIEKNTLV